MIDWTFEEGKNYDDLEELYNQVVNQFNRYLGHVTSNIGGVYEYNKTYEQEGAVYTHVSKANQSRSVRFLNNELFKTPQWLNDQRIIEKTRIDGTVEKIRSIQVRALNNTLSFERLARVIENEALNGAEAYTLLNLMDDLRMGIWEEIKSGKETDTYRRNLQRAFVDRLHYLMTEDQKLSQSQRSFANYTQINVAQSDIRAAARYSLEEILDLVKSKKKAAKGITQVHLKEMETRIASYLE